MLALHKFEFETPDLSQTLQKGWTETIDTHTDIYWVYTNDNTSKT